MTYGLTDLNNWDIMFLILPFLFFLTLVATEIVFLSIYWWRIVVIRVGSRCSMLMLIEWVKLFQIPVSDLYCKTHLPLYNRSHQCMLHSYSRIPEVSPCTKRKSTESHTVVSWHYQVAVNLLLGPCSRLGLHSSQWAVIHLFSFFKDFTIIL